MAVRPPAPVPTAGVPTHKRQWPGAMSWSGVVRVADGAGDELGLAASAAARAAAGLDGDAVPLGEVEQVGILPIPRPACARSGETAPRSVPQEPGLAVVGAAPERTDAGPNASWWMSCGGTPHSVSAGTRLAIIGGWAADVELVATLRQGAPQQIDVDVAGMMEVAAQQVVGPGRL